MGIRLDLNINTLICKKKGYKEENMCKIIDTDAFLATILKNKPQIYYRELREIDEKLVKKYPDIIVDMSAPSIDLALYYYPKLFLKCISEEGAYIQRAPNSETYFTSDYIENELISSSPDNSAIEELESLLAS